MLCQLRYYLFNTGQTTFFCKNSSVYLRVFDIYSFSERDRFCQYFFFTNNEGSFFLTSQGTSDGRCNAVFVVKH